MLLRRFPEQLQSKHVALMLARGTELVIALFATLLAKCAFVPLDPAYPSRRVHWMLDDIDPRLILSMAAHAALVPGSYRSVVLAVDAASPPAARDLPSLGDFGSPHSLMYTIFTSGTTGRPKGVQVEHRSVLNVTAAFLGRFSVGPGDVIFNFFAPCFDPSILDYCLALCSGAALAVWDTTSDWRSALRGVGATILGLTPSAMTQVDPYEALGACRLVMAGGEALPLPLAGRWAAADDGSYFCEAVGVKLCPAAQILEGSGRGEGGGTDQGEMHDDGRS